mgnify:CR=1 FL=1
MLKLIGTERVKLPRASRQALGYTTDDFANVREITTAY